MKLSILVLLLATAACTQTQIRTAEITAPVREPTSIQSSVLAKSVEGFDKISNTSPTDCTYVVGQDGMDSTQVIVGLNSESAPANNVILRIPAVNIPLQEGLSITDLRGNKMTYVNGVLNSVRNKTGEGSANHKIILSMVVSADLKQIQSGRTQKKIGFIFKSTESEMTCTF